MAGYRDVYQEVTNRILGMMEQAQRWEKSWRFGVSDDRGFIARPVNVQSGKGYRGINVPLLWSAGYQSPIWGTYKAWQAKGANVRRGEKGTQIVFFKKFAKTVTNDAGEQAEESFLVARGYVVFNAEQVDGYQTEAVPVVTEEQRNARAEAFVTATGATIRFGGDRAFYTTGGDFVQMPPLASFVGTKTSTASEAYYGTLLHELTHWTGHTSRCAREFGRRFGDQAYAFEELIAELGSAFLSADLGITSTPRQDHANYLANWIEVLRNDKRAIFTAASKAEAATRFLHGPEIEEGDSEEESSSLPESVPVAVPAPVEPVIVEPVVVEPVPASPIVSDRPKAKRIAGIMVQPRWNWTKQREAQVRESMRPVPRDRSSYESTAVAYCTWLAARDGVDLTQATSHKVVWRDRHIEAVEFMHPSTVTLGTYHRQQVERLVLLARVAIPNHDWAPTVEHTDWSEPVAEPSPGSDEPLPIVRLDGIAA